MKIPRKCYGLFFCLLLALLAAPAGAEEDHLLGDWGGLRSALEKGE